MAIPVAIAYSPKTKTSGVTAVGANTIVIDDTVNEGIESFPVASVQAPGAAVLCVSENFDSEDPADYETITYTERDVGTNELRGVTREVEGTAREWPAETWIASFTPASGWNEMRGDVVDAKAHAALTSPHSATSLATANRLMLRDSSGRARVLAPSHSTDIARKKEVDDHAALTSPHSATSSINVNRLILRDSSGRARVTSPSHNDDIASKLYVDNAVSSFTDADLGVNVKDFGAVGDGVADDTTAISNALNSVTDGKFYFPEGTYKVTSQISIDGAPRKIHIHGQSSHTTIIEGNFNGDLFVFTGTQYFGSYHIEGLRFHKSSTSPGIIIKIMGGRKHKIENCHFNHEVTSGSGSHCILSYGPFTQIMNNHFHHHTANSFTIMLLSGGHLFFKSNIGSQVLNNHFTTPNPGASPLKIAKDGANAGRVEGVVIMNNNMVALSTYGIYIEDSLGIYISHNMIDQSNGICIFLAGPAMQITINNNYLTTAQAPTTGTSIAMSNVNNIHEITIADNDLGLCSYAITSYSTCRGIIVRGNRFTAVEDVGVLMTNAASMILTANYFTNCGTSVLLHGNTPGRYIITNNIFYSAPTDTVSHANVIEEHNFEH